MRKRFLVWLIVVPVLVFFSTNVIGSALASRSSVTALGVRIVPAGATRSSGYLVTVARSPQGFTLFKTWFGVSPQARVCWITHAEADRISRKYPSRERAVKVNGRGTFWMLVVYPAWAKDIRQMLGSAQAKCTLVATTQRAFFLPFDVNLS
jgi:hypothetical protein